MKKWNSSRKLVQISAFGLLFLPLVTAGTTIFFGTYISSEFLSIPLTDPLAVLEVTLAGKEIWMPLLWSAVPLVVVALVFGRVFCSWVCPVNTLIELLSLIQKPKAALRPNNYGAYIMLCLVLVMSALISLPLFTLLSPIGAISRAVAFGAGSEMLLVGAIVACECFWSCKAWCRMICPAGALYGLLGRWRPLRIAINDKRCIHCGRCRAECSMNVDVGSYRPIDLMCCTNCGECMDSCAEGAVGFTWLKKQKGGRTCNESV